MSTILTTTNTSAEMVRDIIMERLAELSSTNKTATEKLQEIVNTKTKTKEDFLTKLRDGKYRLTLKQYTNLNSYNSVMSNIFGNKSANNFTNYLNKILESENKNSDAKTFIEKMKENGLSNNQALKLYSALQKYTLVNSNQNYNFISAKI